jgi:outer membrane protein
MCGGLLFGSPAVADTIESALAEAYKNYPQLNVQRAIVRETDEQVPQTLAGYRPHATATGSVGVQSLSSTQQLLPQVPGQPAQYLTNSGTNGPYSVGVTVVQNLYNGFQTANRTRAAESQVSAARSTLRNTEQTVLLNALTAYMNVLRDYAILSLYKRNVTVLQEELRETRDRFKVGEVTTTDVSQAESRLASGQTLVLNGQANFDASVASYQQVIGHAPGTLAPGSPVDRFCPPTLDAAFALIDTNPNVIIAMYNVDVAELQVKIAEGALQPTLNLQLSAQKAWEQQLDFPQSSALAATGQLSVPIYQGGAEYSTVRQVKEGVGQRLLELDLARRQIKQAITQAWSQVLATKSEIKSTEIQVKAAEQALNGVRREARVGQRTTLDVLNAEQELVNARVAVVGAERDRVVSSYTLLAAVGRLSPEILSLPVESYDPMVHYHQVRDAWTGLRTPDGK